MSLAREALRIAAVMALRGRTWAEDRVRDSEQGPVEDYVAEKPNPEVIVYTDDGEVGDARDPLAGGTQMLVVEVVMTQRMEVHIEETGESAFVWDAPQTDAAMELTLGAIERQAKLALFFADGAWPEMFRRIAWLDGSIKANRGASMRDGVRFAGRQLVIPVRLFKDPTPKRPMGPLWTDFLELVEQEEDLVGIAPMLRALFEGRDVDRPDWDRTRSAWGMTREVARALNIAPPAAAENAAPSFLELTFETQTSAPGGDEQP